MQRQGTCNRCGECCGAEGGPDPCSPWSKLWPWSIRNWLYSDFEDIWKYAPLVGIEVGADGSVEIVSVYGSINFPGHKIYWRWVPDHGLCKNLEPYDDPDTWSPECPFLLPDPGDGTRPCVFVGSPYEDEWLLLCGSEPPGESSAEAVAEWQHWFPGCSYTWTE